MVYWAVTTDRNVPDFSQPLIQRTGRIWCCSPSFLPHAEAGCLTAWSVLLQVLAYSCVYSYYNQDTESVDIVEQQTESLELHTNALQILLGKSHSLSKVLTSSCRYVVQSDSSVVHSCRAIAYTPAPGRYLVTFPSMFLSVIWGK